MLAVFITLLFLLSNALHIVFEKLFFYLYQQNDLFMKFWGKLQLVQTNYALFQEWLCKFYCFKQNNWKSETNFYSKHLRFRTSVARRSEIEVLGTKSRRVRMEPAQREPSQEIDMGRVARSGSAQMLHLLCYHYSIQTPTPFLFKGV